MSILSPHAPAFLLNASSGETVPTLIKNISMPSNAGTGMAHPRLAGMAQASEHSNADTRDDSGWTARLARHRTGLALLSFAESTLVPIPLETVVAPLMVGHPRRAITIALAIWVGCLIGAAMSYGVAYWLADPVVMPILQAIGLEQGFQQTITRMQGGNLFWTVFLVSFLPVPMQLATLGAGVAQSNFLVFMLAIAASRALRYFGLAILAQFLGERIAQFDLPTGKLVLIVFGILILSWGAWQLL